jgi:hypothetical protein
MEFIKPKLIDSPSLPIGQDDGSTNRMSIAARGDQVAALVVGRGDHDAPHVGAEISPAQR